MRNWKMYILLVKVANLSCLKPTYEELKGKFFKHHFPPFLCLKPTYEELKEFY